MVDRWGGGAVVRAAVWWVVCGLIAFGNEASGGDPATPVVVDSPPSRTPAVPMPPTIFSTVAAERTDSYRFQNVEVTLSVYYRGMTIGPELHLAEIPKTFQIGQFRELKIQREPYRGHVYDVHRFTAIIRALSAGSLVFDPVLEVRVRREMGVLPLFPLNAGETSAPPAMPHPEEQEEIMRLKPGPLTIHVKPLPRRNVPEDFSGVVGSFGVDVAVLPLTVAPGDPVTIVTTIEGIGNLSQVAAPRVRFSDEFDVHPPVLAEDTREHGMGRRVFKQVVIPRSMTASRIPEVVFSYFDPIIEQYRTVTQGPFWLEMGGPAAEPGADPEGAHAVPPVMRLEVGPESTGSSEDRSPERRSGRGAVLQRVAIAVGFLLVLGAACWRVFRRRLVAPGAAAGAMTRRASSVASEASEGTRRALANSDPRQACEAVWREVCRYLCVRLGLAPGKMTPEAVAEILAEAGVAPELGRAVTTLLQMCEDLRFVAPGQQDLNSEAEQRKKVERIGTQFLELIKKLEDRQVRAVLG